ncbi:MAG TPA: undecaprenyl-diphosphate phosphatase [Acidimicrobiales bacterium]|nr:undecaprenyl-diphosphate phosphatase [Acidimicrobiales bacterium]
MPLLHAIVLGIVQGLSEFLPISSSGHLAIVPWLFDWNDFNGDDSLAKAFDVALHIGTLAGAVAYFRRDIAMYLRAGLRMLAPGERVAAPKEGRIAWLLVASAVPAGITGFLFNDAIETLDDEYWLIGVMLILGGILLLVADRLGGTREDGGFTLRDALSMGIGQAAALQPGVSRSGVTITVARWLRFDRAAAARLSFLMSLPIIAGAGLYKLLDVLSEGGIPSDFVAPFVVGMATSAVTGFAAVWGTIRFVQTRTFAPFVAYRFVVGAAVIALAVAGFNT